LTLSTLVQGAWARLLGQYSGEEDVLFGSVISGRPPDFPGVESMVGLFVNTLPVRTRLRPEPAVSSWLREFQMLQLELHRYGHSSLLDVQGWSEVPRSRPLFESLVAFENYPRRAHTAGRQEGTAALEMGGISSFEQTNYPLTLFAVPGAGIALRASYDPQRFEAMAVRRMLVHLRSFLEALNEVAEAPLAGWSCIGAAERQEILGWSAGPPTAAPASSIGRLLSNQAARTPDAVAVTGDGAQVSYQELNRRARRLARRLRSLGVGPEQRVAICTKRSLDLVTGILGVLEAGGAYVPLDPAYPRERLSFMLEDSGAAVLLTRHELLGSLPPTTARVVCLDEEHLALPSQDTLPSWGEAEPDHLAYVIYTSGSTGRPKGVAIEHRSVLALLDWARSSFAPEELAGVVAATSVCFDLSVFELLVPLSLGGRVILVENALHVASDEAATGATLLNSVPSAVTGLLRGGLPPGVQTVNLAGEPLKRSLVDELYRQAGVRRVLNLYGPSEDTTYSTIATLEPGSADAPDIGRPVSGTRIYLLDGSLFPVPTGLAGELCIAGAGLARGYLGRPELTAERFVPDPFGSTGERLYRTGDRARYLLDGRLDFLGRVDLQVKVRGFRIELGEIEAILASHPGVLEAVVVAHHDAAGEKRLVAFLRLSAEQEPTGTELRDLLRGHLPEPMVPSTFVALDDMPLLPNGKVDRRALAARDLEPAALPSSFAAPRNELERQIAAIWCEVLGLPQVSVQDSFFDIGGHSLLVLQVQKRLQETLETPLAITDLFRFPTIALLAEKLSDQGSADSSAPATGRERAEARRASMQRRQSALAVEEDDAQSST
ncbi:MAG TPA: amino acid adenylation domain-containing protein, partial [Thermoanaerobaculia bacterium]|nr:amino acid adenylation domain-containing protein [Thermoanaerobaculia bacterium]